MLKPLNGHVLVSTEDLTAKEDATEEPKILILNQPKVRLAEGIVTAVESSNKLNLLIGNKVVFHRIMGIDIDIEGKPYVLVKHTDILGKY